MSVPSFVPVGGPAFEELERQITSLRTSGRVYLALVRATAPAGAAHAAASLFVTGHDLRAPRTWVDLDRASALAIATNVLHRDLAYGVPVMPMDRAGDLARRLIDLFDGPSTSFLSNGTLGGRDRGSWDPLTDATFDTGVVCVAGDRLGLLWVADED